MGEHHKESQNLVILYLIYRLIGSRGSCLSLFVLFSFSEISFFFDEMLMNGSKNTAGGFQDSIRDSKIFLNAPRLTSEASIILPDATCCSKDAT